MTITTIRKLKLCGKCHRNFWTRGRNRFCTKPNCVRKRRHV